MLGEGSLSTRKPRTTFGLAVADRFPVTALTSSGQSSRRMITCADERCIADRTKSHQRPGRRFRRR